MLTGITFLLVRPNGDILMQYRDEHAPKYPLVWCFPGGTIEEGENSLSTAVREVKEEYDLDVRKEDYRFLTSYELSYGSTADVFVYEIGEQQPVMKEGKDMKFMNIGEIKKLKLGFEQEKLFPEIEKYLSEKGQIPLV